MTWAPHRSASSTVRIGRVLPFHRAERVGLERLDRCLVTSEGLELSARSNRRAHAHDLGLAVHETLVDLGEVARHPGDTAGDRRGPPLRARRKEMPCSPIRRQRPRPRHLLAGQHDLHGPADAQQRHVVLPVGRTGDAHDRVGDTGVVGDIDEVACLGQFGGAGDGVAMNLRDDRLGEVPEGEPILGDLASPRAVAGSRVERRVGHEVAAEVIAGREAVTRPPYDRNPDVVVEVVGLRARQAARLAAAWRWRFASQDG